MAQLPVATLKNSGKQAISGHSSSPMKNKTADMAVKPKTDVSAKTGIKKSTKNSRFEKLLKTRSIGFSKKSIDKNTIVPGEKSLLSKGSLKVDKFQLFKPPLTVETQDKAKENTEDRKNATMSEHSLTKDAVELIPAKNAGVAGTLENNSKDRLVPENPPSRQSDVAPQSLHEIPNLTSKTGTVEIVDNRSPIPVVIHDVQPLRKQRQNASSSRDDTIQPIQVLRDAKLAVVEADIAISKEDGSWGKNESAAESLAKKIDSQAGNEIVRGVKVILKQAESGEIRINLKPDNLGRVRVDIQMDGNRLSGRIFVESAVAREAFQASIEGLQNKLMESGFNSADLELYWDQRNEGAHHGGKHRQFAGKDNSWNRGNAMRDFDSQAALSIENINGRVNMVI